MKYLPSVVKAEYVDGHRIRLAFDDGSAGIVDFRRFFKGAVFEPLKRVEYFRRFELDGCTVCWPNGADIAPETLYEAAKKGAAA